MAERESAPATPTFSLIFAASRSPSEIHSRIQLKIPGDGNTRETALFGTLSLPNGTLWHHSFLPIRLNFRRVSPTHLRPKQRSSKKLPHRNHSAQATPASVVTMPTHKLTSPEGKCNPACPKKAVFCVIASGHCGGLAGQWRVGSVFFGSSTWTKAPVSRTASSGHLL